MAVPLPIKLFWIHIIFTVLRWTERKIAKLDSLLYHCTQLSTPKSNCNKNSENMLTYIF